MSSVEAVGAAGILARFVLNLSRRARERRGRMLRARLVVDPDHRILDLGGGDGSHIHLLFPDHRWVVVADVNADALRLARSRFGYETVRLEALGRLPFADKQFDFVFCSSVIEHTTGFKPQMTEMTNSAEFRRIAWANQVNLAREIERVARSYWVQTPNKTFVVESHSWLPGAIVFLPRKALLPLLKTFAAFWPKATLPDWSLLNERDMRALFPACEIITEKSLGLTKSLIAFKG